MSARQLVSVWRMSAVWLIVGICLALGASSSAIAFQATTTSSELITSTSAADIATSGQPSTTDLTSTTINATPSELIPSTSAAEATTAAGGTTSDQPSTTVPTSTTSVVFTERDPAWRAEVTLGCGITGSSRVVQSFEAGVNPDQTALLYLTRPQAGGVGFVEVLSVGSDVPVPAEGSIGTNLAWSILNVFLGPWRVDRIIDNCVPPAREVLALTGPREVAWLIVLGGGMVGVGVILGRFGKRRFN